MTIRTGVTSDGSTVATASSPPRITCRELFVGFTRIGITGVGGVLPQAQYQLVEKRQWLTAVEFAELLSVCQLLPGPNIGNVAIMVGLRYQGWRGAVAAFVGMMFIPFFVVLLLAAFYREFGAQSWVAPVFHGFGAGAAGLVLATGYKLLRAQVREPWVIVMAVLAFGSIAFARLPLIPVLVGLAPIAVWCSWHWLRKNS